jgi:hypothetical protein
MQDDQTIDQENQEPSRRRFLKAAAGAGVVGAVWSEPLIRGIPAYAADSASMTGALNNQFISWSPMRDNWDNTTSGAITQSPDLDMGDCGDEVAGYMGVAFYTIMGGTLSDSLTLTASGNPGGDTNCFNLNSGLGFISLDPGTGCMFTGVSVSAGSFMLVNMESQIQWDNTASSGLQMVNFSISCG